MIREINEKLEKFLEKQLSERNIIPDIIAKYGDLTIPEFIDEIIKAEKNGEEILEESLNEGYPKHSFPNINDDYRVYLKDISSKYFKSYKTGLSSCIECKINEKLSCVFDYRYLYTQTPDGFLIQLILDQQRWKDTADSQYDNLIIDVIRDYSKDIKHDWDEGASHYYYFVLKKFRLQKLDDNVIFQQFSQCIKELLSTLDVKYEEQNKSLRDEYELVDIKQTVKNKNIKVKQALSKSAIARKIMALQNPTPEQLARILAAIE